MNEHLSQESSEQLNKLGVVVESGKVWVLIEEPEGWELWSKWTLEHNAYHRDDIIIPAPTFIELWERLPEGFDYHGKETTLDMWKSDGTEGLTEGEFCAKYRIWDRDVLASFHHHESPVEAVGMLFIWLAENGHLEVKA